MTKMSLDLGKDMVRSFDSLHIVKPQNHKSLSFEKCVPSRVMISSSQSFMSIAIDLDNQPGR